jgi:hypothetical protein
MESSVDFWRLVGGLVMLLGLYFLFRSIDARAKEAYRSGRRHVLIAAAAIVGGYAMVLGIFTENGFREVPYFVFVAAIWVAAGYFGSRYFTRKIREGDGTSGTNHD